MTERIEMAMDRRQQTAASGGSKDCGTAGHWDGLLLRWSTGLCRQFGWRF